MSTGSRIREERKKQDLTLRELAEKADISISYLGDIEKERSKPSIERLIDIARALNKNVSFFIDEDSVEEEISTFLAIDDSDRELLNTLLDMPGFKELLREFDGFENWSEQEKAELLSFLKTKRKYKAKEREKLL